MNENRFDNIEILEKLAEKIFNLLRDSNFLKSGLDVVLISEKYCVDYCAGQLSLRLKRAGYNTRVFTSERQEGVVYDIDKMIDG